jgi:ribonuclease P protein component
MQAPVIRGCLFLRSRMTMGKPYSLNKSERLKSRKQIDALFESGKKITQFPYRLVYNFEQGKSDVKAGFTVSSKNFPAAVDRNRIKRLTRESYRKQKNDLKYIAQKNSFTIFLFFIYTGREILPYDEIFRSVKKMHEKLAGLLNENPGANH